MHLHVNRARIKTHSAWNLRHSFRLDNFKFYNLFSALTQFCFAYLDKTNKLSGKQLNAEVLPSSQHRNSFGIGRFMLITYATTNA